MSLLTFEGYCREQGWEPTTDLTLYTIRQRAWHEYLAVEWKNRPPPPPVNRTWREWRQEELDRRHPIRPILWPNQPLPILRNRPNV